MEPISIPSIDLLTMKEVYDLPGVMQTGNTPLPPPFFDFRPAARKIKSCSSTDHVYWLRRDIETWLNSLCRQLK